jgi:hypothetical protein
MHRPAIIVAAIASFGLAVFSFILGVNLVPTLATLTERGLVAPWYVVWVMIWLTVLSAVTLGVFLIVTVTRQMNGSPVR